MGPLTSKQHQERVLHFSKVAHEEGGEILTGGKAPDREDLAKGCFVEPTVVRAKITDTVSQEEVFGPFVTVTTFADDDEALAIANGVKYGLGSGLWTVEPVAGPQNGARDQCRHGLDQLLQGGASGLAVRRRRRVRLRPRDGVRGDARIHLAEVGLGQCRRPGRRRTTSAERRRIDGFRPRSQPVASDLRQRARGCGQAPSSTGWVSRGRWSSRRRRRPTSPPNSRG